ncbi:MAG: hypothetical protein Q9227_007833 [Pyrenula ochraceoflavens]
MALTTWQWNASSFGSLPKVGHAIDACEWENFASLFHPTAYVYTTWTGRIHYLDFIAKSQAGMDAGAFIMHRCHGSTTDINPSGKRAVTKLKATITQRFMLDDCPVDAEADCRFCFFFGKEETEWKAYFVRHWYEKDKLIPCNPSKVPQLDEQRLKKYPEGYRYLSYCQEETQGIQVKLDMPGHRRDGENENGKMHDKLLWQCKQWLDGENPEV